MSDAADPIASIPQLGSVIPHFWYDIIGRIEPGAYLLAGLYWFGFRSTNVDAIVARLAPPSGDVHTLTLLTLFAVGSYFVGGFLGPLSYVLVWIYDRHQTIKVPESTIRKLGKWFGSNAACPNESDKARRQCQWLVWRRAPHMAMLISRWDAFALAARSTFFSSLVIIVAAFVAWFWSRPLNWSALLPFLVPGIIGYGSIKQFSHYREISANACFDTFSIVADSELP